MVTKIDLGILAIAGLATFLIIRGGGQFLKDFKFPEINLPEINLPEIKFPEFPDFTNIFKSINDNLSSLAGQTVDGVTIPADTTVNPDGTVTSSTGPTLDLSDEARAAALRELELNREIARLENQLDMIPQGEDISGAELASAINDAEFRAREAEKQMQAIIQPSQVVVEQFDSFGGGPSFIGGVTTFGNNLIDTLSEVLNIFPNLTASQARDALEANPNLLASQFVLINPDIINLSSEGEDPNQVLLNASGGFSGLTPDQIAQLLTGGNINNF